MITKRLVVELSEEMHNKAKSKAYAEGKTLKDWVIELIKDQLNKDQLNKDQLNKD